MVADPVLQMLASYLKLDKKILQKCMTEERGVAKGPATSAKCLAREQKKAASLLGSSAVEQACVDQWLEYAFTVLARCPTHKDIYSVLKELDEHVTNRVFFVGQQMTLADLVLFYNLHIIMANLDYQTKERYINLSRWFKNMQQHPDVQQSLPSVTFMKTPLYNASFNKH